MVELAYGATSMDKTVEHKLTKVTSGGDVGCWYQKGGIFQIFRRQLDSLVLFFG